MLTLLTNPQQRKSNLNLFGINHGFITRPADNCGRASVGLQTGGYSFGNQAELVGATIINGYFVLIQDSDNIRSNAGGSLSGPAISTYNNNTDVPKIRFASPLPVKDGTLLSGASIIFGDIYSTGTGLGTLKARLLKMNTSGTLSQVGEGTHTITVAGSGLVQQKTVIIPGTTPQLCSVGDRIIVEVEIEASTTNTTANYISARLMNGYGYTYQSAIYIY